MTQISDAIERPAHGVGAGTEQPPRRHFHQLRRPRAPDESPASHALRLRLFRRKATVTARLEHPGIVPLHDVGTAAAGEPAYVMKRLLGTTLAARIPLPPAEAAVLLLRVADAVGFAHHQGVVHRDLKPEHVWLGADGEVLLLD